MADNKQRVRQHEPLRVPQGWTDQARSLVMQIERVFDKIFSLLGKHREDIDGKKDKQTAKTSPSASGNTLAFIDTISQDEEGVITATKKNVSVANNLTTTAAGSVLDARQGKALDDAMVHNTGNETVAGVKTFDDGWITKINAILKNGLSPYVSFRGTNLSNTNAVIYATDAEISGSKYGRVQFNFRQYSPSSDGSSRTSYFEGYLLPQVDAGRTNSVLYQILTTKNAPSFGEFSIPASGSKTFTVGANFRGVLYVIGGNTANQAVITVCSNSSSVVAYQNMGTSSHLTITTGTGTLKIANSASYAHSCWFMVFMGSVS